MNKINKKINKKLILTGIRKINLKTLYFNFKYLPLKQAVLLPVWISKYCWLKNINKSEWIIKTENPYTGMIQVGYGKVGVFDKKMSRTILEISGQIIFNGKTFIGHGSKISIGKNGIIEFGKNVLISAETTFICKNKITIGDDCLFSWDILVMDTDQHNIRNQNGEIINCDKEILIGSKNWICCRSTILKGVQIASGNIIAANTVVTKSILETRCILGGNPIKVLKENMDWGNMEKHE
jgi:acetyltransferase-like isoleucine patch superfamily enzyme